MDFFTVVKCRVQQAAASVQAAAAAAQPGKPSSTAAAGGSFRSIPADEYDGDEVVEGQDSVGSVCAYKTPLLPALAYVVKAVMARMPLTLVETVLGVEGERGEYLCRTMAALTTSALVAGTAQVGRV
jgi:hypothetical protein